MKNSKFFLILLTALFLVNQINFCAEVKDKTELVERLAKDFDEYLKDKRSFGQISEHELKTRVIKYQNFKDLFAKFDQEKHILIATKILKKFFYKKSMQHPREHTKLIIDTTETVLGDIIRAVAQEEGIIAKDFCSVM